jgi:hypothetical protein
VLGAYQKANTYANAQIAFGRLYNTLGFDPLEDDYGNDSIKDLSAKVKQHFEETEKESLKMKSNLFGNQTKVAVKIQGVQDQQLQAEMQKKLVALLARNNITNDPTGLPLTFKLTTDTKLAIEKANWNIELTNAKGQSLEKAAYSTKMPEQSRQSIMEASLIAAATSNISHMKSWLAKIDEQNEQLR